MNTDLKKRNTIRAIAAVALALLVGPHALMADSTVTVGPIRLSNLTPYAGKYVHLFFVRANEAMLGLKGYQLEFTEIKAAPPRQQIAADGTVTFQPVTMPKTFVGGVVGTYTHLFIAITEAQPDPLYLRNRNGVSGSPTPITDPRISAADLAKLPDSAFHLIGSGFASKINVAAHTGPDGVVTLDALTGLTQPKP